MTTLDIARRWAQSVAVIPVPAREKATRLAWKPYQTSLPSDAELVAWFSNGANLAIVTGHQGLTVIDFDSMDVFNDWLSYGDRNDAAKFVQRHTYQVQTSKGRHVYVRLPDATKSRPLVKADGSRWGIDIKSRGGYVLAPPSIHPDGSQYRALNAPHVVFVSALSDILPPEMLIQADYQPRNVAPRPVSTGDIWDRVTNPVVLGDGIVDRIKAAVPIESLFTEQLSQTGGHHFVVRCPLHDDHNPSMWVDTDQQIAGCYAGCTSKPLDVINLYARIHDLSNSEAIRELARGL